MCLFLCCTSLRYDDVLVVVYFSNKKGILSRRMAGQAARSPHKASHIVTAISSAFYWAELNPWSNKDTLLGCEIMFLLGDNTLRHIQLLHIF